MWKSYPSYPPWNNSGNGMWIRVTNHIIYSHLLKLCIQMALCCVLLWLGNDQCHIYIYIYIYIRTLELPQCRVGIMPVKQHWAMTLFPKWWTDIFAGSHEVSKMRDSGFDFSNRCEIWQAAWQRCCQNSCQISERYDHWNIQSHDFETSRDLAVRRPSA